MQKYPAQKDDVSKEKTLHRSFSTQGRKVLIKRISLINLSLDAKKK